MTHISKLDVAKLGGKGAMLLYLQDKGIPNIPEFTIKKVGEETPNVSFEGSYIVRSSSPNEDGILDLQEGKKPASFAGLFHSEDCRDKDNLESAIRNVENSTTKQAVKKYAENHNVDLTKDMAVIIQKHSGSKYRGSITRHPNNEDEIILQISEGRGIGRFSHDVYYSEEIERLFGDIDSRNLLKNKSEEIEEIVNQYKEIEKCLDKNYSYQVEFGLEPTAIYQARPFKKKEVADFELPKIKGKVHEKTSAIGITPESGISLPVFRLFDVFHHRKITDDFFSQKKYHPSVWQYPSIALPFSHLKYAREFGNFILKEEDVLKRVCIERDSELNEPYCFAIDKLPGGADIAKEIGRDNIFDVYLKNMKAFVDFDSYGVMEHDGFRILQDAKVSLLFPRSMFVREGNKIFNINNWSTVRIYSNGKQGMLVQEKFSKYSNKTELV